MYKILIVDDESIEREGISFLIEKYKLPLEVAQATNGKTALEYMRTHPIDILLTDVKMPQMDGLELARHTFEKYPDVCILLSGVRPCVVAMILATALSMALSTLFGLTDLQAGFAPDLRSIAVFAMLGATHLICKIIRKTAPSPILMILFSAGLGILFW